MENHPAKKNSAKEARWGTPVSIGVSLALLAAVVVSVVTAVTIGSTHISVKDVYSVILYELFHPDELSPYAQGAVHDVVWLIRLPRLVLAAAVGAGLSVCGTVMQAVVKNSLADPYILGVSSGASFGATLAIMLGVGAALGRNFVGIVAFLCALGASALVMMISNLGTRSNPVKLLLSGMAISAVFSAFSSFIVYLSDDMEGIKNITYWLMGSLAGAAWSSNAVVLSVVLVGTLFFMTQYRTLNLMLLGDEVSITLGTNLHRYRQAYMLATSLIIGFVVYSSGMIGFVGLIIPHFMRMLFGSDHKKILPTAALTGAIFLIWADVLSRIIIPHTELPIGILVSMVGAPCFVYLLVRRSYGFGGDN
ncbi:iron complex transport system permease protein [Sporobacter termitidis DSM 10068]|uniref:Iron complex transport system permease protein n=1 Tax=Sporobacter termitidis DSM 10068 TaxID=1123282 RepID=A0A1M5VHW7_9FIRM|nr:iron ABC transporter permease [Sporobacter termitidis]SHH74785.1 iron complex transport system permease protein [Sporobacter termitidis DSM 10068]